MAAERALPALALALALVACGAPQPERPRPEPGSVVFDLEAADSRTPTRVGWRASYEAGGATTRFRIEMEPERKGTKLPTFVRCALIRETGSDGSPLIRDLSRALGARRAPAAGPGAAALELSAALLGRDLSRGTGKDQIAGLFSSEPAGSWIVTKLFLAEGTAEVFLSLDPIAGYGEFSIKDPVYGDAVVRELGRLLLGEVAPGAAESTPPAAVAEEPSAPPPAPTLAPDPRVRQLMEQAGPGVRQPERRQALESLAGLRTRAREALPVFLVALKDEDPLIRGEALRGLPALRPEAKVGIEAVTPLLKDPLAMNQVWAAGDLAEFGQTQMAVVYLTVFLKGDAKTWAAAALTRIGPEARGAVPFLIEMLEKRTDPQEGYGACRALAAIGRDASRALPALRVAAGDVNPSVREAAKYAIKEIEGR